MSSREGVKPPVLTTVDVGVILGEERARRKGIPLDQAKPLASKSVSQYLVDSKKGGKLADHPFPPPAGRIGNRPYWLPEQGPEIRKWARERPGEGVGGGRPYLAKRDPMTDAEAFLRKQVRTRVKEMAEKQGIDLEAQPNEAAQLEAAARKEILAGMAALVRQQGAS
jgi:hypothetical protein